MKNFFARFGFAVALGGLITSVQAVILPVAENTSSNPKGKISTTTGTTATLTVSAKQQSFIIFDLSTLPTNVTATSVTSARLNLYVSTVTTATASELDLFQVTSSWQEIIAPAVAEPTFSSSAIGSIPASDLVAKTFVEVDVTSAVTNWLAVGTNNFGLAITTSSGTVTLGSKEGLGSGFPAMLEIETSGSTVPTYVLTNGETAVNLSGTFSGGISGNGAGLSNLTVAAAAVSSGTNTNALTFSSTSNVFAGNGAGLTHLAAAALSGGTNTNAITFSNPSNVFVGNGAGLTGLVLPNVPISDLTGGTNTNTFTFNNTNNVFVGNGAGLNNLSVGALSGTDNNALSLNNTNNLFVGNGTGLTGLTNIAAAALTGGTNTNAFTFSSTNNVLVGAHSGDGSLLTNLTATNISAGTAPINITGNAANFTGNLAGDVTGPQGTTVVGHVGGVTAANVALGANAANAATSANTASTIVARNASGNFTAGTITAGLTGNVTGNVSGSAASFTGNLAGNVTGTQGATVISTLPAISGANLTSLTAANITSGGTLPSLNGVNLTNLNASQVTNGTINSNVLNGANGFGLTNLNIALSNLPAGAVTNNQTGVTLSGTFSGNGSGLTSLTAANISAGTAGINITGNAGGSAASFTGNLAGDVTGPQGTTVVGHVGGVTAANVALGANAANAATSANTASTIVARSGTGAFSAGAITGTSFTGSGSGLTSLTAANISAGTAGINITGNAGGSAASFTGNLVGDVTGTQGATLVATASGHHIVTNNDVSTVTLGSVNLTGTFTGGGVGDIIGDGSALTNLQTTNITYYNAQTNCVTDSTLPDPTVTQDNSFYTNIWGHAATVYWQAAVTSAVEYQSYIYIYNPGASTYAYSLPFTFGKTTGSGGTNTITFRLLPWQSFVETNTLGNGAPFTNVVQLE